MPFRSTKDPASTLDYVFDWSEWLAGDIISTSGWVAPPDLTVENGAGKTDTTTTVWLSGGIAGKRYEVVNQITTAGGRVSERTLSLPCADL